MSTIRTASSRGRGGSTPNSRGVSPLWTQRQNFFSAVSSRCWYSGSAWIVISTHLPPPVMIDSTAERALATHMLCCSCAMCFSAAASSEKVQGSMNLASNTAPVGSTRPSSVAAIHLMDGMLDLLLDVLDGVAGVALVPAPVQVLGDGAELDDQVVGEVLGLDLAALLPPQPNERGLIVAHDDAGVRAADEGAAIHWIEPDRAVGGGEG